MRVLELFAGTASVGRQFEKRGHTLVTVDVDPRYEPTIVADVMDLTGEDLADYGPFQVVWASPPCNAFSVASVSRHWRRSGARYIPKSDLAVRSIKLVLHTLQLIHELHPDFWFLENPVGMLRKMPFMQRYPRVTVTYCQYGDRRRKPTDIWGNRVHEIRFRPMCRPGDPCHEHSPRGVHNTGVQGQPRGERAKIPPMFGEELARQVECILNGRGEGGGLAWRAGACR